MCFSHTWLVNNYPLKSLFQFQFFQKVTKLFLVFGCPYRVPKFLNKMHFWTQWTSFGFCFEILLFWFFKDSKVLTLTIIKIHSFFSNLPFSDIVTVFFFKPYFTKTKIVKNGQSERKRSGVRRGRHSLGVPVQGLGKVKETVASFFFRMEVKECLTWQAVLGSDRWIARFVLLVKDCVVWPGFTLSHESVGWQGFQSVKKGCAVWQGFRCQTG